MCACAHSLRVQEGEEWRRRRVMRCVLAVVVGCPAEVCVRGGAGGGGMFVARRALSGSAHAERRDVLLY